MTVDELNQRMHSAEYIAWIGFSNWRAEKQRQEAERAQR